MRMTQSNLDLWFKNFVKEAYDQLDETTKKEWDKEIENRKSKIGSMYNSFVKATDTLDLKQTLEFPKKTALLINDYTLSSGELFTMLARQSDKVVIQGQNSRGMMDYGNIVHYKTTCPKIRNNYP
jgi:C-terminal processing protease CtpA/Prc